MIQYQEQRFRQNVFCNLLCNIFIFLKCQDGMSLLQLITPMNMSYYWLQCHQKYWCVHSNFYVQPGQWLYMVACEFCKSKYAKEKHHLVYNKIITSNAFVSSLNMVTHEWRSHMCHWEPARRLSAQQWLRRNREGGNGHFIHHI